jgi:hypothetical protein
MRWKYKEIDGNDYGETYTCTKPNKSDRLEFTDGRTWLVERVTLHCLPMQITEAMPIVGVLQLRKVSPDRPD